MAWYNNKISVSLMLQKHLCNQSILNIWKTQMISVIQKMPLHATAKSKLFAVGNKDEWDTKEDSGKSMKNALYVLWYAKSHLSG